MILTYIDGPAVAMGRSPPPSERPEAWGTPFLPSAPDVEPCGRPPSCGDRRHGKLQPPSITPLMGWWSHRQSTLRDTAAGLSNCGPRPRARLRANAFELQTRRSWQWTIPACLRFPDAAGWISPPGWGLEPHRLHPLPRCVGPCDR